MKLRFQPKGSMCAVCADKDKDCSHLEFYKMLPVMETYQIDDCTAMIVKCSEFKRLQ